MPIHTWGNFERALVATVNRVACLSAGLTEPKEPENLNAIIASKPNYPPSPKSPITPDKRQKFDEELKKYKADMEVFNQTENGKSFNAYNEAKREYQQKIMPFKNAFMQYVTHAIKKYYEDMRSNQLGAPNNENLKKLNKLFVEQIRDEDSGDYFLAHLGDGNDLEEKFENAINKEIEEQNKVEAGMKNTIKDIACFRFAADGRIDHLEEHWSLEGLGNLATEANINPSDIRQGVMDELGRHAQRQVFIEMEPGWKVTLCGGFGKPQDVDDIAKNDIFPEHMWLELSGPNNEKFSIDTFPNANARISENVLLPPSEPDRIDTPEKTKRYELTGVPMGILKIFAEGVNTTNLTIEPYTAKYNNQKMFIAPNGTLLTGVTAEQEFQKLSNPLHNIFNQCNTIKPDQIIKSKTMPEATKCKNDLLDALAKMEVKKGTLVEEKDKVALQQKIDELRVKIESAFSEKEKIGKTIEQVKVAAQNYLDWSNANATGLRFSNLSHGSYGRQQAENLLKMINENKPMVDILKATNQIVNSSGTNKNSFTRYLHDGLKTDDEKLVGKESLTGKFKDYKEQMKVELDKLEKTEESNSRMQIN